ncbi:hypothetical protein SCLCIDRAFT_1209967 [Scleroderma citrinum Foug A]|uniref:Uncharacterized protein n=1 Tax=Scleroderma citrinum Foug A TaxID=1036808 RepID=A0A0C3EHT3_9AGAM|nr:hypothetical protein SCLCIDRAFT_1209967 [Scleroderma citrinum Foug A]
MTALRWSLHRLRHERAVLLEQGRPSITLDAVRYAQTPSHRVTGHSNTGAQDFLGSSSTWVHSSASRSSSGVAQPSRADGIHLPIEFLGPANRIDSSAYMRFRSKTEKCKLCGDRESQRRMPDIKRTGAVQL